MAIIKHFHFSHKFLFPPLLRLLLLQVSIPSFCSSKFIFQTTNSFVSSLVYPHHLSWLESLPSLQVLYHHSSLHIICQDANAFLYVHCQASTSPSAPSPLFQQLSFASGSITVITVFFFFSTHLKSLEWQCDCVEDDDYRFVMNSSGSSRKWVHKLHSSNSLMIGLHADNYHRDHHDSSSNSCHFGLI